VRGAHWGGGGQLARAAAERSKHAARDTIGALRQELGAARAAWEEEMVAMQRDAGEGGAAAADEHERKVGALRASCNTVAAAAV
jgi:hypothetical protein